MYDIILVRYGEMTLKKKNYKQFQILINKSIKEKCKEFKDLRFDYTSYRFYIYLNGVDCNKVIEKLNTIVGLSSYSLGKQVEYKRQYNLLNETYDKISNTALELINYEYHNKFTFKVETNRSDKAFPSTSIDISKEVAKRVLAQLNDIKVDVHNPEVTLNIDLRTEGIYVYTKVVNGLGGYPSKSQGKGLLMMSGGIDSPVAGYLAIRKGVDVYAIHYASPPYTSLNALQKVIDLLQVLANYTIDGRINLYVVPFTKIQDNIHEKANPIYLVTLMRRAMYKIADRVICDKDINCIINGESIGQVASQTLESMSVVNEVTNKPIIRPLATFDKEEIIKIAKKIKTFDISIRPYEDCCTVFVPEHPIIKPKLESVLIEENKCDLDNLIEEAIKNIKEIKLNCFQNYSVFGNDDIEI